MDNITSKKVTLRNKELEGVGPNDPNLTEELKEAIDIGRGLSIISAMMKGEPKPKSVEENK